MKRFTQESEITRDSLKIDQNDSKQRSFNMPLRYFQIMNSPCIIKQVALYVETIKIKGKGTLERTNGTAARPLLTSFYTER